jgi:hypothetical protein
MALITSTFEIKYRASKGDIIGIHYATTTYKLFGLLPLWKRDWLVNLAP